MPTISIDANSVHALNFVVRGAGKTDHEAVIFVDLDGSGQASITNADSILKRSMVISVDDDHGDEKTYAFRAKSIESILKKVDEDRSLSIGFKDDKINIACGSSSVSLKDLYPYVVDMRRDPQLYDVSSTDAVFAIPGIVSAAKSASKDGIVAIADDGNGLTIGSGAGDLYTQEIVASTLLNPGDDYHVRIIGGFLGELQVLNKMETLNTLLVKTGEGLVEFVLPFDDAEEETDIKSVSYRVPTLVTPLDPSSSPCDGDISPIFSIQKSILKESLTAIRDVVVGKNSIVSIDSTQDNRLVVRVSDNESEGKTVIVEDVIITDKTVLTASLATVVKAVSSVHNSLINIGKVSYKGDDWIALSAEFDDTVEDETDNSDMIVAVQQRSFEE